MKERRSVRYDTQLLPKSLSKVKISWEDELWVEANVANFCTHGMRIIIPALMSPVDLPKKNDAIKVKLPIVQVYLNGMCIYVTNEIDDSISIGIYYYIPIEQNYLNKLLSKMLNIPLQDYSFVCHEWEELVENLCSSDDPKLNDIGSREKEMLKV